MRLSDDAKAWMTDRFGANVRFDEPMSRHTYLRVGGPAQAFVTPETIEAATELVQWARHREIAWQVMGNGSNILVKDGGIAGIVIVLTHCRRITREDAGATCTMVTAMAGCRLSTLCRYAFENGLEGMNFAIGIPGTVGGGIVMNAGTTHGDMAGVVESVEVLFPEGRKTVDKTALEFGYRRLSWRRDGSGAASSEVPVVLSGAFRLTPADAGRLKSEAAAILESRQSRQPLDRPSAGSFFKNPPTGDPAGKLIEAAGLKGRRIGGAQVSEKHANFIINAGKATAADILSLMTLVQDKVSAQFNIQLVPEVKIVGI